MSLKCPACHCETSVFNLEADLNFDRCEECKGMWLDKGELARMTGNSKDFPDPQMIKPGNKSPRQCPKCPEKPKMTEVTFVKSNNVLIDVCKLCYGLWLDSRELVQVQQVLRQHRIDEKKKRAGLK